MAFCGMPALRSLTTILSISAYFILSVFAAGSPAMAQQTNTVGPVTRACKNMTDWPTKPEKGTKKNKKRAGAADPAASQCLELRMAALEVQEFLQKYVREKQWNIADEETSEDTWTLTVILSKEELVADTKPLPRARVQWRGGKALVRVQTAELGDGYSQVIVSARFDGYGESEDQFAMKRESWALESSGALESSFVAALKARFESGR